MILLSILLATSFPVDFVSCYDGDTCRFDIHLSIHNLKIENQSVRLCDIDAPEMRVNPAAAQASRDWLISKIENAKVLRLQIPERRSTGRYGRLLGWIWADGINLNERMVHIGLAEEYRIKCK